MRLQRILEKYLPLIGNMLIQAFLLAGGLFVFLAHDGLPWKTALLWHGGFYLSCLVTLLLAMHFNRARPLFWVAVVTVAYILINQLKMQSNNDLLHNVSFNNLVAVLPFNLLLLYLASPHRLLGRRSIVLLVFLLVEYTLGEWFTRLNLSVALVFQDINLTSVIGFALLIGWAFVLSVKDGRLYDYTILLASISIGLGVYNAAIPSGVSLFFGLAQILTVGAFVYHLIYGFLYDEQTGLPNHHTYRLQSRHFPLKYTLTLISIDSYDKLAKGLGSKRLGVLTALVADIIVEHLNEEKIYRYAADKFVIIYKQFDKKETIAAAEDIRRAIAGVSFALGKHQKPLKLTVSCSVADKKRSDANASEVLMRAEKAMQETLKFTSNVTSQG